MTSCVVCLTTWKLTRMWCVLSYTYCKCGYTDSYAIFSVNLPSTKLTVLTRNCNFFRLSSCAAEIDHGPILKIRNVRKEKLRLCRDANTSKTESDACCIYTLTQL